MKRHYIYIFGITILLIIITNYSFASNLREKISYLPQNNAIYTYYYPNSKDSTNIKVIHEKGKIKFCGWSGLFLSGVTNYYYFSEEKKGLRIGDEYGQNYIVLKYPICLNNSWVEDVLNEGSIGGTDKVTFKITFINKKMDTPAGVFEKVVIVNIDDIGTDYYFAPNIGLIRQDFMGKPTAILTNIKKL